MDPAWVAQVVRGSPSVKHEARLQHNMQTTCYFPPAAPHAPLSDPFPFNLCAVRLCISFKSRWREPPRQPAVIGSILLMCVMTCVPLLRAWRHENSGNVFLWTFSSTLSKPSSQTQRMTEELRTLGRGGVEFVDRMRDTNSKTGSSGVEDGKIPEHG